jgi:hypothetical protein
MFNGFNLCLTRMVAMAKALAGRAGARGARQAKGAADSAGGRPPALPEGSARAGLVVGKARFEAVMRAAEQSGLLTKKSGRIGGRVSSALVRQAKRLTGIRTDTDLLEFALATVALEDNFADAFRKSRGKVDPALKLGV